MSRADVTLIRPLIYTEERDIITLAKNLPVVHNPCPANKHTERESMKDILRGLAENYPDIETRFANALQHPDRYNLWDGVYEKYLEERGQVVKGN
jgi:tRNA(Ile)-lysidine synthase TilS/MesJ